MRGSMTLLLAEGMLFILVALALGILVSARTSSQRVAMMGAMLGTMLPTRESPRLAAYLPTFSYLAGKCAGVRRAGSCALDMAHLAAGRLDGFWAMSLRSWDAAAGALLVSEAGGRVGDFAGGADFLRGNEVIAAAPGLFTPLREAISVARRPPARIAKPI